MDISLKGDSRKSRPVATKAVKRGKEKWSFYSVVCYKKKSFGNQSSQKVILFYLS